MNRRWYLILILIVSMALLVTTALAAPGDQDDDNVPDALDSCPTEGNAGHGVDFEGCPFIFPHDNDEDDFIDYYSSVWGFTTPGEDQCPGVYGTNNGCPDQDEDGVPDIDDDCPTEPGPADNAGCPLPPDDDEDGVPNIDDECPTEPGPKDNNGCPVQHSPVDPDWDDDGLNNSVDFCPELPGPMDNGGCPWGPPPTEEPLPPVQPTPVFDPTIPAAEFGCAVLDYAYIWVKDDTMLVPQFYCDQVELQPASTTVQAFTVINAVVIPDGLPGAQYEAICLKGQGQIVVLPSDGSAAQWMPSVERDGYTCAAVPALGVMALVTAN